MLGRALERRGFVVDTHVVTTDLAAPNSATPFPSLDGYDLLVPMGSMRSLTNTDEIDSWIGIELDLVRTAHQQGMPVLGICFGGQIIAAALGGKVEKAPVFEHGWYELADGPDGPNPVGPGPWLMWHEDRFMPPPEAEVLAVTEDAVQLIRIGTTVGTQFHPEIDLAHFEVWLNLGADHLRANGVDPDEFRSETARLEAHNIEQCQRLVDWYLSLLD